MNTKGSSLRFRASGHRMYTVHPFIVCRRPVEVHQIIKGGTYFMLSKTIDSSLVSLIPEPSNVKSTAILRITPIHRRQGVLDPAARAIRLAAPSFVNGIICILLLALFALFPRL
ncbi:hypothetical protein BDR07DRAFT_285488 [Suillus spraguei]|nr:hypothetical protein BDR07DRAFT_285488 [Suillus spraguei]